MRTVSAAAIFSLTLCACADPGARERFLSGIDDRNVVTDEALRAHSKADEERSDRERLARQLRENAEPERTAAIKKALAAVEAEHKRQYVESAKWQQRLINDPALQGLGKPIVRAAGRGVVPGAIICPNLDRVELMFRWYSDHWSDQMVEVLTKGESRLLNEPVPPPALKRFGCAFVPHGEPMLLEERRTVPVVSTIPVNGTSVRGVTHPAMMR